MKAYIKYYSMKGTWRDPCGILGPGDDADHSIPITVHGYASPSSAKYYEGIRAIYSRDLDTDEYNTLRSIPLNEVYVKRKCK